MGKPVVFGDSGVEFTTARNLGSFEESIEPTPTGDGDERDSNESVTEGAGGDHRPGASPVDPSTLGSDAPYGYTASGRRRNRPVGSGRRTGGNSGGGKSAKEATGDIAELLEMIHWGIATALKTPEIELTPEECQKLAASITRITELYGNIPGMDEKTMAWLKLAGTAGTIYGTRVMAMKMSKKKPVVIHQGFSHVG